MILSSNTNDGDVYFWYMRAQKYTDKDGNIIYNPDITAKAAKVGWTQRNWFYTNVTFLGTDISRAEVESLVKAVMLGTSIDEAFANAKTNLKLYLQPEQQ